VGVFAWVETSSKAPGFPFLHCIAEIKQQNHLHYFQLSDTLLVRFPDDTRSLHPESVVMSYEERIRRERKGMSKGFGRLADFLLDSYIEASFLTASELAHALNLDAATVVRFSQALGYKGFPELQRDIRQRVKNELLIRPQAISDTRTLAGTAATSMTDIARDLEQTRVSLDTTAVEALVEQIGNARRVIVLADGLAEPAANHLIYFLEQGGFLIYLARSAALDLARTVHTATSQDLILAVDISGQTPQIANALRELQARGVPTAAIVGAASLATARAADMVIAAQSHLSIPAGIVMVTVLVYVVAETLRWRFAERFSGAEQAIHELSGVIQQPVD
jgi:DNA-binding MurR/RpiR family transcriptional regulator